LSELAKDVGVSYCRLSHLFADNVGMTLSNYRQCRKIRKAISLSKRNSTPAQFALASGFTDAAHFWRAFLRLHTAPYFLQSDNVKIISPARYGK
jgi:AraC-like DNA-binding protein